MCAIACPSYASTGFGVQDAMEPKPSADTFSLKDLIGDGILWAVPKHRKTIERRLKAKYGNPKYHMKLIPLKSTLRICMQCGHDHEVGVLCRKCQSQNKTNAHKMLKNYKFHTRTQPVIVNFSV